MWWGCMLCLCLCEMEMVGDGGGVLEGDLEFMDYGSSGGCLWMRSEMLFLLGGDLR